ncbi:unnamed protein product, partial [Mesorhabditis belari]|uniref:Uncharacterized protein n=1 Tax=Mesorhabditis belari TaxID=2138241 RepID=A0AAF3EPB6_9BILA
MLDCGVCWVLIAIGAWVVYKVFKSGLLSKTQVSTTDKPALISKPLVVYYKHQIGHYKQSCALMKEARSLLPSGATTFGIYYDDPDEVAEHLLQSAVGVVFAVDGENRYEQNYAEQLTRHGYEKMSLPAVSKAVQATQPFDGFLSIIALVNNTYAAIKEYIKETRIETSVVLEFYTDSQVNVVLPLDHEKEFFVPEYMSTEALESKMARKKFDSDESDSESEPDGEEDPEDEEGDEEKKDQ